jgi:hypothetical protein
MGSPISTDPGASALRANPLAFSNGPSQEALGGEKGSYLMENPENLGAVSIRRYRNAPECDVIVGIRDREMVVRLPDYRQAVKWAQMESRAYKLPDTFLEEQPN